MISHIRGRVDTTKLLLLAAACCLVLFTVFGSNRVFSAPDATLSNVSPHRKSSDPEGAHIFLLRKNNLGKNTQLALQAYYPVDTKWDKQYIYIDPFDYCNIDFDTDNKPGDSVTYLTVALSAGGKTDSYHIKIDKKTGKNNVCSITDGRINDTADNSSDKNKLFARYPLPEKPETDDATKLLKVTVEIIYNDIVTQPVKSDAKNNQQRFQVRAQTKSGSGYTDTDGALVGPTGGNDGSVSDSKFNFPIIGRPSHVGSHTQVSVPFGLPCSATSNQDHRVGVYDSDNFAGATVRFRVKDKGTGEPGSGGTVWFREGKNAKEGTPTLGNFDTQWFTPNQDNAEKSSVEITMKPDHKYQIEVVNIDGGNTIVVNVPTETIYGVINCSWKIKPDSKVEPHVQEPGKSVVFTHTATNTGQFKSDPVTSKVKWGKWGVLTSGTVSTDPDRTYNPETKSESKTFTNTYPIPLSAAHNSQYCQYLEVKPHSKNDSNDYDSWQKGDRACVTVIKPTSGNKTVSVSPAVSTSPPEIEPTEYGSFDAGVTINNFPEPVVGGWGFNEIAKYGTPIKQDATQNTYNAKSSYHDTIDVKPSPSQGSCAGKNKKGECNSWYWYCSGNNMGASKNAPSCAAYNYSYNRYKHTCDSYNYINTSSSGTCNDRWTCPAPNGKTFYGQKSAPNCNVWKCAYGGSNYLETSSDGDSEKHCEKRCGGGAGDRPHRYTAGDMNCYQKPSFTLTCYWDDKPTYSVTITANGTNYCDNIEKRQGVTIGTDICATLTANYPAGGWSSAVQPGYGSDNNGASYKQINTWIWSNLPSVNASNCIEVVGKPTTKIRGGDIMVGTAFMSNSNVCSPAPSANIVGWPHEPAFDAAYTELAAFAGGNITGFATSKISSNVSSSPPRSLAFANFPASGGHKYGGGFGTMKCSANHYGDPSSYPTSPLASIGASTQTGSYRGTGGQIPGTPLFFGMTIPANRTIQPGVRAVYYVDGDVTIVSNILYNRGGWINLESLSGFKLVVKGNIFIDRRVSQLNGIYVAQPRVGSLEGGGNIYTCTNGGSKYAVTDLYSNCQTLLTVNGAFIAKKVHLQRTSGTAIRGETAEQFNYLPEVWLTSWPKNSSADSLKYDSIISLPPVL